MIGLFRLRAVLKVHLHAFLQRTLAYFLRGSISVRLTSCLTGLDHRYRGIHIERACSGACTCVY